MEVGTPPEKCACRLWVLNNFFGLLPGPLIHGFFLFCSLERTGQAKSNSNRITIKCFMVFLDGGREIQTKGEECGSPHSSYETGVRS